MKKVGKTTCYQCSTEFERTQTEINRSIKLDKKQFCSRLCFSEFSNKQESYKCTECNSDFSRSPSGVNKSKNVFCSSNCSAVYNNKMYPKRKQEGQCKECQTSIKANLKYCTSCRDKVWNRPSDKITLKELTYLKGHKANAYGCVRSRARTVAKSLGWKCCSKCGYDKHIEIAHIKQIPSFHEDTLISVINDPNNLLPLCPNCHWEFDHPK